jgi:hypothetical protein
MKREEGGPSDYGSDQFLKSPRYNYPRQLQVPLIVQNRPCPLL